MVYEVVQAGMTKWEGKSEIINFFNRIIYDINKNQGLGNLPNPLKNSSP